MALIMALFACKKSNNPIENPAENKSVPPVDIVPGDEDSEEEQGEDDGSDNGDHEPEIALCLVKFTDDKYRDSIIAVNYGDCAMMRKRSPYVIEELVVGTNPYSVKLPNGYWVVDWRWDGGFIYPPYDVLLPYKWETLTHWDQKWELPDKTLSFNQYMETWGFVLRRVIDAYFSLNQDVMPYSDEENLLYIGSPVGYHYVSEKDIPSDEKDYYFGMVHAQDSLHPIYVQRLLEIINNGDFDRVYNKHKLQ